MLKIAKMASYFFTAVLLASFLNVCTTISTFAYSTNSIDSPSSVVSWNVPKTDMEETSTYWTPARMKAARHVENIVSEQAVDRTRRGTTVPAATPHYRAPFIPGHVRDTDTSEPANTPSKKDAYSLPHGSYSRFPYSTIGKIFFTDARTGTAFVCSGTAVVSNNKSVVDTAGHCVNQGNGTGNWYTHWSFCPQYYNGSTPYGCWIARKLLTSPEWYSSGSFEDNFGEAVVTPNSRGYLMNIVGGAGWAYNRPANQSFNAFGYPAASPFNGKSIYYCVGRGTSSSEEDGYVVSIPCNMTGGSSGGPWFISVGSQFGYVNGHNDFTNSSNPNHMYSPYYDSGWYAVFNAAQNS